MSTQKKLSEILRSLISDGLPARDFDKLIAQVEVVQYQGKKYVLKKFTKEVGVVKWIPPIVFFRINYPYTLIPKERFERELKFFNTEWRKVETPKIIESDPENLIIVREFINGRSLSYEKDAEKLGCVLAHIHESNWALGDTKPSNFLVDNQQNLYVIDAEQSIQTSKPLHKAWDLMLTAFFAAYRFLSNPDRYSEVLKKFFDSYLDTGGSYEILQELTTAKFSGLAILMPLPHVLLMSDVLEEILKMR